jgi:hypothetical protein
MPALSISLKAIMNSLTSRSGGFLLWATGLIVTVAFAAITGAYAGNASDPGRLTGVFTGRFANGMPIYTLPSITVVADHKAELAKIKEQSARGMAASRRAPSTAAGVDPQRGGV